MEIQGQSDDAQADQREAYKQPEAHLLALGKSKLIQVLVSK
jgi:hypothetical protein